MKYLVILILLVSCGQPENNTNRCYTKEEALNACIVDEISKTGVSSETANLICQPYYEAEFCYSL